MTLSFVRPTDNFQDIARQTLRTIGSLFAVRQRYLLTRRNTLRLRYVAATAATVLFLATGLTIHYQSAATSFEIAAAEDRDFVPAPYEDADDSAQPAVSETQQAAAAQPVAPQPRDKTVKIGKGDTLNAVLQRAGVSSTEAFNAVEALKPYYNPRSLTPGQKLSLHFDPAADTGAYNFSQLTMALDPLSTVKLKKTSGGSFHASVDKQEAVRKLYARRADIRFSLYGSALKAHIPSNIVSNALRIYAWDVDFQRDIQPGDALDVMYEQYETPDGQPLRSGDIVYARLTVSGKEMPVYRFKTKDGDVDYFTPTGGSVRKALLSTPVDGARISSGFGVRVHPVLGYSKMHKGIDFAASRGTPIYAAGNGTIEKMGPFSSYGNYVRIRHNSSMKTAYAHMSRFANGLRSGMRVKQGQVIGYVGMTGRATGSHLHYEILMNNRQVNPRGVKVQQGESLHGAQLAAFKAHIRDLDQRYAALMGNKFAAAASLFSGHLR